VITTNKSISDKINKNFYLFNKETCRREGRVVQEVINFFLISFTPS
jgi:hypothetical protein